MRLRVALVGYPSGSSRADILGLARHFEIDDQVEAFELLDTPDVARLLQRSKVHVLWSRKEGVNRAVIEAMFAGVPSILRQGFNFGTLPLRK